MTKTATFIEQTQRPECPAILHFKLEGNAYDSIHTPALRSPLPEMKEGEKYKLTYNKCGYTNDWWITKVDKLN